MTERHAAQAPALRERFHHSSIDIRHSSFQCSFTQALPLAKKTASLIKEKKLNPQIVGHRWWERFSTAITQMGNRGRPATSSVESRPLPQTFNLYLNGFEYAVVS